MPKTPTSVLQLVVSAPTYISYTDACCLGAGGVWCSGTKCLKPFLCQVEWPHDIQGNMVTSEKQNGTIKINDLELAGALLWFQRFIFGSLPTSSQERVKQESTFTFTFKFHTIYDVNGTA